MPQPSPSSPQPSPTRAVVQPSPPSDVATRIPLSRVDGRASSSRARSRGAPRRPRPPRGRAPRPGRRARRPPASSRRRPGAPRRCRSRTRTRRRPATRPARPRPRAPRRAGPSAMVRTAGPTRSTIDASGVWCAASFAIATITCVPSTRSLRLNEAPVPILPMRLEYQLIDEATLPCSGSTAVAANETLTPRSTEAPVAGLVMVTTGARLVVGARAAAALTMPPVATLPVRLLIGRTVARMRSRICEHRPRRVRRQHERGHAGDVRAGHRRAVCVPVAARQRAQDVRRPAPPRRRRPRRSSRTPRGGRPAWSPRPR